MTDPISDMLTSIRNALIVKHPTVDIPFSNLKHGIAKVLEREGFIEKVEKKGKRSKRFIEITLKYLPAEALVKGGTDNLPAISGLKRISKPGQRIYSGRRKIKKVKGGYGIAIISTAKGLMTDKEARKQKLGGEIMCEIW
jgi:small subunit ribosomal protein S8